MHGERKLYERDSLPSAQPFCRHNRKARARTVIEKTRAYYATGARTAE